MHSLPPSDFAFHARRGARAAPTGRAARALRTGACLLAVAAVLAACSGRPSPIFSSATYTGRIDPTVAQPAVVDRPAEAARASEEERQRQLAAQAEADATRAEAEVAEVDAGSEAGPGDLRRRCGAARGGEGGVRPGWRA